MTAARINWKPTERQLGQFGTSALIALPVISWIGTQDLRLTGWMLAAGAALAILSRTCPAVIRPLFVGTMLLTFPVGILVGELTMLVLFFGLLTPLAIVFRVCGRDLLERRPDRTRASYWHSCAHADSAVTYYRQS